VDAVPAAGSWLAAVGHPSAGRAGRSAQAQVAACDIGEGRRCAGEQRESQMVPLEGQGLVDVVDHVVDIDGVVGHQRTSLKWVSRRMKQRIRLSSSLAVRLNAG
jgi:hypothetical protein